jgi:hypothetical protein
MSINVIQRNGSDCKYVEIFTRQIITIIIIIINNFINTKNVPLTNKKNMKIKTVIILWCYREK